MKKKLYKDTIHGLTALAASKNGAWMLIRADCKKRGIEVPTFDKIIESENESFLIKY